MSRRNVDPSWLRRRASNKFCGDEEMCQPAPFSTCPRVPARPAPRRSRTWSTDLHRWIASIEEGIPKVDGLQIPALVAAVVQELDQEVRRSRGAEAGLHFAHALRLQDRGNQPTARVEPSQVCAPHSGPYLVRRTGLVLKPDQPFHKLQQVALLVPGVVGIRQIPLMMDRQGI